MAEIVGVVAAAAQLTAACLSLLDAIKSIKRTPIALQRHQVQLESIQHISLLITQNPLLQTIEVESQTKSILALVEDTTFTLFSGKNRLSQFWTLARQERNLLENFNALERHKTSLLLVIDNIQASAIHRIHSEIISMADKKIAPASGPGSLDIANSRSALPASSRPGSSVSPGAILRLLGTSFQDNFERYESSNAFRGTRGPGGSASSDEEPDIVIDNPFAGNGCHQLNGRCVEIGPGDEKMLPGLTWPGRVNIYNPVSEGAGNQDSGLVLETDADLGPELKLPRSNVYCSNPRSIPVSANGNIVGGTQRNGTIIRRRK